MTRVLLIALDSVGIDPLGHDRPDSVYAQSRFLFPRGRGIGPLADGPVPGALVETVVIVTSDHGHLEQVAFTHGHPKSRVPTWHFGPDAETQVQRMRTPEGIFHVVAGHGRESPLARS